MTYILALAGDHAAWAALVTLIAMEVVLGIDVMVNLLGRFPDQEQPARDQNRVAPGKAPAEDGKDRLGQLHDDGDRGEQNETKTKRGAEAEPAGLRAMLLGQLVGEDGDKDQVVDPDPGPDMFDSGRAALGLSAAVGQILVLDLVFSIDSIVTAVGMTEHIPIMVAAVLVAVAAMALAAGPLANFIAANPTVVMLALGFLLMIGTALIAEGFGAHVPKGYIYAAMAFSALVEGLNMLARRARKRRTEAQAARRG